MTGRGGVDGGEGPSPCKAAGQSVGRSRHVVRGPLEILGRPPLPSSPFSPAWSTEAPSPHSCLPLCLLQLPGRGAPLLGVKQPVGTLRLGLSWQKSSRSRRGTPREEGCRPLLPPALVSDPQGLGRGWCRHPRALLPGGQYNCPPSGVGGMERGPLPASCPPPSCAAAALGHQAETQHNGRGG